MLYYSSLWAVEDFYWTTPSQNSSESMPLGGGDIGMNVWVDAATNEVRCLYCQSGCFDENNTLLKGGLLHIMLTDPSEKMREQRLCPSKGSMLISFEKTTIEMWVDVWKPVIHIEANQPIKVIYESWRKKDVPVNRYVGQQTSWKWIVPSRCITHRDSISQQMDGSIMYWHQNTNYTIFDYTLEQQGLKANADMLYNPLEDRIFGGCLMKMNDQIGNTQPVDSELSCHWIMALCNRQGTIYSWKAEIDETITSINLSKDKEASQLWWKKYWERSFVESNGKAKDALRNYALFRFMLGCNAHPARKGERWPTKFNGGLFTFHPTDCDSTLHEYYKERPDIVTADYRRWGGGVHTAQNQRLIYWPMLQTGDWDALQAQLDFYDRIIPAGELRSKHYWEHNGACFTEQIENFGLPNPAEYGKHKYGGEAGVEDNRWLEYEWDTSLEFADMYCLYPFHQSPHGKKAAATAARRMIMSCLRFFDEHYDDADSLGNKIIYPGSACESYKITRNASSTIAALKKLTSDALEHADELELSKKEINWLKHFSAQIPPIPTYQKNGKTCIAAAESWRYIQNIETPQLYPLWPWSVVDKELAHNTYLNDSIAILHRSYVGWKQDNIWAALVGEKEDAWNMTMSKLSPQKEEQRCKLYRFPAFWGPGYDWMPDHNWGGSAMLGLHAMLMQEDDEGTITILPAWPKEEDVHFKLWDKRHRAIEVDYKNGKVITFTIDGKKQPNPSF